MTVANRLIRKENKEKFKKPYVKINRYRKKAKPMTLCMAAICDIDNEIPKIVFCSDRLITCGDDITFEHGCPKYTQSKRAIIMVAGDPSEASLILNRTMINMSDNDLEPSEFAEVLSKLFRERLKEKIEENVLNPLGINYENLKDCLNELPVWMSIKIKQDIENSFIKSEFLIAGFDKDNDPHIYTVSLKGGIECHDFMGFAMIGNGSIQAQPELTRHPYTDECSYLEAIAALYYAKKTAERVAGVGSKTDLGMILVCPNCKKLEGWKPTKKHIEILNDAMIKARGKEIDFIVSAIGAIQSDIEKQISKEKDKDKTIP